MKSAHGVDYLALLRTAHSGEKWKTQEAIRQIFRDRTIALTSAKAQTHRGQMQRQIVKHGQNSKTSEVRDQCLPALKGRHDHVKHVVTLFAFGRARSGGERRWLRPMKPARERRFPRFDAASTESGRDVQAAHGERPPARSDRQIARADIDPGVFVDFTAEKSAPVRSLFPKDLGSLIELSHR